MILPHTPSQQCQNLAEFNPTFPPFDGLDINQMIDACQEHHNTTYGVRSLWYAGHGEYTTLMPCDDYSCAPSYLLERNINGFYLLNDKFGYNPAAQAEMMNWINQQVLPAYLLHPEISVKPFDIKLEELGLDMMDELDLEFD